MSSNLYIFLRPSPSPNYSNRTPTRTRKNLSLFHYLVEFFFLLLSTSLSADLCDHLKPLSNKSSSTLNGIDFIYLINLDERPEKLQRTLEQLAPYKIIPHRFSAVNGWKLTLEEINDVGLKFSPEMDGGFMATCYPFGGNFEPSHELIQIYGRTYFCHCLSRGAIGIALSHISILQDAWDSGYETIWVLEDDIEVIHNPHALSEAIRKLDYLVGRDGWDILFTDKDIRDINGYHKTTFWAGRRPDFLAFSNSNNYSMKNRIDENFCQIGARSGAHSMIIRRSGIKKLLRFFQAHQIFFPYDMEYILPPGIKLFTVQEDIVSNLPKAPSDNGGPTYIIKELP